MSNGRAFRRPVQRNFAANPPSLWRRIQDWWWNRRLRRMSR